VVDYRSDERTRCTRCRLAVPSEQLFNTIEGDSLCEACKLPWAEEQAREARAGGSARFKLRPGYRLICPTCDLATMEVRESEMLRLGRCLRCKHETTQLLGGAFLGAALVLMGGVALSVAMGTPVVFLLFTLGVVAFVGRDQLRRRRHRAATFNEIERADASLKTDRQRAAGEALRIATPDSGEAAEAEAAEAEAAEAEAVEARGESRRDNASG
jgi:hypothetical protein